jgi:hypothetical protein
MSYKIGELLGLVTPIQRIIVIIAEKALAISVKIFGT